MMNIVLALALLAGQTTPSAGRYFAIQVVDEETGRGVPLVELRTVGEQRFLTDSSGLVAFYEPGLMGQKVFFYVKSHGYELAADGFGYRGKALEVAEGGSARIVIRRRNIAERLYRVTGGGIYRDSVLLGRPVPIRQPVLNGQVLGQDSVLTAVYRGRIYWFWGDTNRPAYPLGNFHTPGATSLLPSEGGLDPGRGVDLEYFLDEKGFAKPTARLPGDGPTWLGGLFTLRDASGRERMFAGYVKIRKQLEAYERGVVEFDDAKREFVKVAQFEQVEPSGYPAGHTFVHRVGGVDYVYFATPYPLLRVRADPDLVTKPSSYEAFTCSKSESRREAGIVERSEDGAPRYGWKSSGTAASPRREAKLIESGRLKPDEALLHLQEPDTGERVTGHGGSVDWNAYRGRWVMIVLQSGGTSALGEVWYAEADSPVGPWVYARKVATHERYSFYNPRHHAMLDKDGGRTIFFEGTYSHTFSGNSDQTPLYDYNQVMYKLDLADPRLALPVAVYQTAEEPTAAALVTFARLKEKPARRRIPFLALDRPAAGTVPVCAVELPGGGWALRAGAADGAGGEALFHALPAEGPADQPVRPAAVPLYEIEAAGGKPRTYTVERPSAGTDGRPSPAPICRVWRNPLRIELPWD